MNSLSWLIYLADVLPKLAGGLSTVWVIFGCLGGGFWMFCWTVAQGCDDSDEIANRVRQMAKPIFSLLAFTWFLGAVGLIIPSKETIYMIAGSEAGEYVVKTPEAQEIVGDIKEIIKIQLEEMKTPK